MLALAGWMMMLQPLVTNPGVHELELVRDDASTVLYTLSIPEGVQPSEPRPLVIALHFAGRDRPHFGRAVLTRLVEPGLRQLGAIIAAPDSPGRGWNHPDGERAVLDLIEHLSKSYPVDSERIVLTGYSLGGMGTWYIAARHPETFSAAIPMAGAPRGESEEHLRTFVKLPIYAIHSRLDTVVPLAPTEEAMTKLRGWGAHKAELTVVEDVTHYETAGFVPYLRDAVDWLRDIWTEQ